MQLINRMALLEEIYKKRGILASVPLIFSLFCSFHEIETDWLIWPLGIIIILLGVALRIWAEEHIHYRFKMTKHLATTGPYSFVRNPLYIGNIMICTGATVLSELLWLIPITILWCVILYSLVVRYEENFLAEKYGEAYYKYINQVPRWIPNLFKKEKLQLINAYLERAVYIELRCLLIILPYIIKESLF